MYLADITIKNFREFKELNLELNNGLNLLVGENDSGKTAIIDAIKFVLGTHSRDWLKLTEDDFHISEKIRVFDIKIICIFKELTEKEAAMFLEWLSIENNIYYLKLTFTAKQKKKGNGVSEIFYDIKAGEDEESGTLSGEARNKLNVTYLKPLRDAQQELKPRRYSRLSQILSNYDIFQTEEEEKHELVRIMDNANDGIGKYFEKGEGNEIYGVINDNYLDVFSLEHNKLKSKIEITSNNLNRILEKLELTVQSDGKGNLGLGSHNLLFIATEMLLLKVENYLGLKLSLIEEIEAHLHPQSQLNLIDFLNKKSKEIGFQSIITTHSNSLASKVDLENLILCRNGNAFSMRKGLTKLSNSDYAFLSRFLDATKANLFFANAVIIVEGDAENLLIPTLAEFIGYPLHKYGISIVNVGSTALLRYANIFLRANEEEKLGIPVAVITDLDIKPKKYFQDNPGKTPKYYQLSRENIDAIKSEFSTANDINFSSILSHQYWNKGNLIEEFKNLISKELGIKTKVGEYLRRDGIINPIDIDLEGNALEELKEREKDRRNHSEQDVKYFIAPNWTLEYEIALSCLKKQFYKAILIASLVENNIDFDYENEECQELITEKEAKVNSDITYWEGEGNSNEDVAYKLYWEIMQKNDSSSKISKAITAQTLSHILKQEKDNQALKDEVLADETLKYLIDAIKYAVNVPI